MHPRARATARVNGEDETRGKRREGAEPRHLTRRRHTEEREGGEEEETIIRRRRANSARNANAIRAYER